MCLYTSVHRCILRTRDLALVQQRELTLSSDIPHCKSNWNHFSLICIWFPKITMVFLIFHMVDSWFFRLFIHKNTYVNRVLGPSARKAITDFQWINNNWGLQYFFRSRTSTSRDVHRQKRGDLWLLKIGTLAQKLEIFKI